MVAFDTAARAANVQFYTIEVSGGNSVNALAATGKIVVRSTGGTAEADFMAMLKTAAKAGCDAENTFRNVTANELAANGTRLDVYFDDPVKVVPAP
jgi:hypothetical protein